MGEVIGFKGTPKERLASWKAMLLLRAYLSIYKGKDTYSTVRKKDDKVYKHIFNEYIQ